MMHEHTEACLNGCVQLAVMNQIVAATPAQVGDWVKASGIEFKVHSILGNFLMVDEDHGFRQDACIKLDTKECGRCHEKVPVDQIYERYSYTVYAGKMCDACAYNGYIDHCGLDGGQGDPQDLDEDLEPEEY